MGRIKLCSYGKPLCSQCVPLAMRRNRYRRTLLQLMIFTSHLCDVSIGLHEVENIMPFNFEPLHQCPCVRVSFGPVHTEDASETCFRTTHDLESGNPNETKVVVQR